MNWSDVLTFLAVVLALMLLCGLMSRFLGRRFCRPRAWAGRNPTPRGFGCCCGRPDHADDRGAESAPRRANERMTGNGR